MSPWPSNVHLGVVLSLSLGACTARGNPPPSPPLTDRAARSTEQGAPSRADAAAAQMVAAPSARPPAKDRRCGYVDETGRVVIARRFYDAGSFAAGVAAVREKDKFGFVDAKGD